MIECDFCGAEFEPRKQGKPGRFCPGTDHRRRYYREGGQEYAEILKKRRAATKPRLRLVEDSVEKAKDRAATRLALWIERRRQELAERATG